MKHNKDEAENRSTSYAAARQQEILKLLSQDASVSVADLAAHFNVSKPSIRRDLRMLDEMGLLQRTYGGAVRTVSPFSEATFSERKVSHHDEKIRIGEAAAQQILPGMVVFIDGGTTTDCIVPFMLDRNVTVVTYALNVMNHLATSEEVTLIGIGGTIDNRTLTFGGVLALASVEAYNMQFDIAFISCAAVSARRGVTNDNLEVIPIKRIAIESAQRVILLADSSKVGRGAAGSIAPIDKFGQLITGNGVATDEVKQLRALGIDVELV